MNDFITPPNHKNFLAKKLFADMGEIIDLKELELPFKIELLSMKFPNPSKLQLI
ncbi:MAG: hypothetical protein LBG77_00680 [Dysgonamonadaceae bacterium]|jgi:hypothetical protein|nr:hypothetical protein [Dysgonamonadaceae bacterium]